MSLTNKVFNLRSRTFKYNPFVVPSADLKSMKATTVADTNTNYQEDEINSLEGESICSSDLNYGLDDNFVQNIEKEIS